MSTKCRVYVCLCHVFVVRLLSGCCQAVVRLLLVFSWCFVRFVKLSALSSCQVSCMAVAAMLLLSALSGCQVVKPVAEIHDSCQHELPRTALRQLSEGCQALCKSHASCLQSLSCHAIQPPFKAPPQNLTSTKNPTTRRAVLRKTYACGAAAWGGP